MKDSKSPQTADKVSDEALVCHEGLVYVVGMLKKAETQQQELEWVTIDSLVPAGHLLRKIDGVVDFGFIRDRVKPLYCADNGRPALDLVVLFKLLLLGYLYGVRAERQLMREVEVNVAYRWFLGLRLRDKVPDASTLSQNRRGAGEPRDQGEPDRSRLRLHGAGGQAEGVLLSGSLHRGWPPRDHHRHLCDAGHGA
jgi:transposase